MRQLEKMAGLCYKRRGKVPVVCEVPFDGGILPDTRAKLVVHLIKHILYQRQQIPLPYDQVKMERTKLQESEQVEEQENDRTILKRRAHCSLQRKHFLQAVSTLEEIFANIEQVFASKVDIQQVLVILGSTPISPKESYLIMMPSYHNEHCHQAISYKHASRTLFKTLVSSELTANSKLMSTTKLSVLLCCPRQSSMDWFMPKPTFKVPSRGQTYIVNFTCDDDVEIDLKEENLTCSSDAEFEISGIAPLEASNLDLDVTVGMEELDINGRQIDNSMGTSDEGTLEDLECLLEEEANDLIWFQAPVSMKGYKDKATKCLSSGDLWI